MDKNRTDANRKRMNNLIALSVAIGTLMGIIFLVIQMQITLYDADRMNNIIGQQTKLFVDYESERIRSAAMLMSTSTPLINALRNPYPVNIDEADIVLDRYCSFLNMSVCYLMDKEGITISSTNRFDDDSFVGRDLGFQTYFTSAMEGKSATYPALGTISDLRGLYSSYPVYDADNESIGVAVIKQNIDQYEEAVFSGYPDVSTIMLVDENGIVFMSNKNKYILRPLWRIGEPVFRQIDNERQYVLATKEPMIERLEGDRIILDGNAYAFKTFDLRSDGWQVISSYRLPGLTALLAPAIIIALIVSFIMIYILNAIYQMKAVQNERETRKRLKQENQKLEAIVSERTDELQEKNKLLEKQGKELLHSNRELKERIDELEKFHRITVNREIEMMKLKETVEKLQKSAERRSKKTK